MMGQNETRPSRLADMAGGACVKAETARREPRWDECPLEVKIERLRIALLQMRDLAQAAYRNASRAQEVAENHDHNALGAVTVPVHSMGNRLTGLAEGRGFDPLA